MGLSNDTFGAMMVGAWISMIMFGITTLQTYYYYYHYPKDRKAIKIIASRNFYSDSMILDTVHVILMCHALHYYLVTSISSSLNIVIAFVVQAFFTQRIYSLCRRRKWLITGVIGFTVFAHFETVVFIYIKKDFSRIREMTYYAAVPFAISVVLSDVFISAALCMFLDGSRTGYEDTNSIINRLMVFSINRCILICIVALVELIVFIAKPHSLYVFAIDFIVGKLYANSLLAALNSRMAIRTNRTDNQSSDVSTSFNLATMPSTVRTETTGDVRQEHIPNLQEGVTSKWDDEKPTASSTRAVNTSSSDHLTSIVRRPGTTGDV
ncbi:hypothetical protein FA15DRAFT_678524 [Coprinopsis marcescibilis]|uniref:DUF6534 domain-containing protein n=1 Tax=Coprinopsis marcescibilis TaxID=230819 RepID=A0A5C3L633_COPMA|nr:hypothetical protein FA15DRAFT_678524 [Coprinopsis marcescibilis]